MGFWCRLISAANEWNLLLSSACTMCNQSGACSKLRANDAGNFAASKQLGTTGSRVTVRNEPTLA